MASCPTNITWSGSTELSAWNLSGQNSLNTDSCQLYGCSIPVKSSGGIGGWTYRFVILLYKNKSERDSTLQNPSNFVNALLAGGLNAVVTPNTVTAGIFTGNLPTINEKIILQEYNGSGISGDVWWNGQFQSPVAGTIYFSNAPTPPVPPIVTTTTTTYPGPNSTTTTTPTTTTATTTAPTSTTTTTTPLLNAQVIQYLDDGQTESVTARRGALSYGTMAPGETGRTIIVSLFAPYVKSMNNISLGLIDTGGIEFNSNVFSIASSIGLDSTTIPSVSFMGVNNVSSSTSNFNFGIPNRDDHTSAYVYLNVKLPRNNFIGTGTVRYKFFFDYSD